MFPLEYDTIGVLLTGRGRSHLAHIADDSITRNPGAPKDPQVLLDHLLDLANGVAIEDGAFAATDLTEVEYVLVKPKPRPEPDFASAG